MSRLRNLGWSVLVGALVVGGAACSSDEGSEGSSDRAPIEFADPPEGSTDLGLCNAYDLEEIKALVGGEETFKRLPPAAIGQEGDAVTGEICAWERVETNGDSLALRVEVRNFGDDTATLEEQFADLESGTLEAEPVEGVGDAAFSSASDETSLLQIRSAGYLLTLSSRSNGGLDPVTVDELTMLGATGLEQLP